MCLVVPDPGGKGEFLSEISQATSAVVGRMLKIMFQPSCGSDGGDASKALVAEALFLSLLGTLRFGSVGWDLNCRDAAPRPESPSPSFHSSVILKNYGKTREPSKDNSSHY